MADDSTDKISIVEFEHTQQLIQFYLPPLWAPKVMMMIIDCSNALY